MSVGFLGGTTSSTKSKYRKPKVTAPTFYMPSSVIAAPSSANSSQGRTPPERFDLGQMFAPQINATQAPTLEQDGSPDPIGTILGLFGKVAEFPVNLINQPTKAVFGERGIIGAAADALDPTPVGAAVRGLNTVLDTSSRMVGVAGNAQDMALLRQVASMPDTAPLPSEGQVQDPIAQAIDGVLNGLIGPSRAMQRGLSRTGMTVGQFRQLMADRGMTPEQITGVQTGKLSIYDPSLGAVRLSDDGSPLGQLQDAVVRMGFDPTNLAFGIGGKALRLAGVATHGIGLEKAARAAKVVDYALAKPARETGTLMFEGAKTMVEGGTVVPTMKGLARYVELAQKGTLWNARIGVAGLSTAVAADSALTFLGADKDQSGWGRQIKAFTSDLINDRPLSEGAAFMVLSAVATPIHTVIGEGVGATKSAYRRNAGYALYRAADIALGRDVVKQIGRQSADNLVSWAARNMALNDLRKFADFQQMTQGSAARTASAKARLAQYVDRHMQRMVEDGRINAHTIADEIKRQDRFTEGMFDSVDARPFNAVRASQVWQKYEAIQQRVGAALDPLGLFIGRNVTLTQEMSDIVLADMAAAHGATPRMNSLIDAWGESLGASSEHATLTGAISYVKQNDPALYAEITAGIDMKPRKASKKNGPARTQRQINAEVEAAFSTEFDAALRSDVTVSREWIRDTLERHTEIRMLDKAGGGIAYLTRATEGAAEAGQGRFTFLRYDLPDAPATAPYAEARLRMKGLQPQMPTEREYFHELDVAEARADSEVLRPQADPETLRADAEAQMTGEAQAAAGMWENVSQAALDEQVAMNAAVPPAPNYGPHQYTVGAVDIVDRSGGHIRAGYTYHLTSGRAEVERGREVFPTPEAAIAAGEEQAQRRWDKVASDLGFKTYPPEPTPASAPDYAAIEQQVREGAPGTGAGMGYRDQQAPAPEAPPEPAPAEPQVYRPTASSVSATKITAQGDIGSILDEMSAADPAVGAVRADFDKAFIGGGVEAPRGMTVDRFTEIVNQAAWEKRQGRVVDQRRIEQLLTAPKALPLAAKGLNWDPSILSAYDLGTISTEAMVKATPLQKALESEFGMQQYTVKIAPNDALTYGDVSQALPDDYLYHSTLAALLFDNRASTGLERMLHAALGPTANVAVAKQAHEAWTSELVGKYNASTAEVDTFMRNVAKRLNESQLNRTGMLSYRGITAMPVWELKAAFNESFDVATRQRIATAGDTIDRILDRSANRFIRNIHERNLKASPDGQGRLAAAESFLPRAVEGTYKYWQSTLPGGVVRSISKTYYFLFRFALDPRWWLMNGPETDWLAGARYGVYATRAEGATSHVPGVAARTHGAGRAPKASEMSIPDEAWMSQEGGSALHVKTRASIEARALEGIRDKDGNVIQPGLLRKNIDTELSRVVPDTIDALASQDPTILALRERFGDNPETWSQQLYEMLYDFDTRGVQKAVDAAVVKESRIGKADLSPAEREAQIAVEMSPEFQALRERLVDVNRKSFKDVTDIIGGNMNRSNAERVLNSYWLYWPLSYQIKATKWLAKVMMTGSAIGPNATAAITVENLRQTHIARMATDEDYANIFKKNETLWQLAQQLVPVTPWDMGVSLSRLPRYAGGWMGLWPEYQTVQDPLAAGQKMMQLGPLYTIDMLRRVYSEAQRAMNN